MTKGDKMSPKRPWSRVRIFIYRRRRRRRRRRRILY
jgi:hypothetical protein